MSAIRNREIKDKEMSTLQTGQEVTQARGLARMSKKAGEERHLQAWHYLIPVFAVFWIAFGSILILSGFLFLAVSALAVLALFSILIIALAWAYQNDR
jgi:hypothetical protein